MKLRHLLALVWALALGVGSLATASSNPAGSLAGASIAASVVLLGVGWALVACGVVASARRPSSRFGMLLVAAGSAWFLVEFNNPGAGSPIVFTVGLLTSAACPALVAHAALAYPGGRLAGRAERVGLSVAYASTILVLGLLPALVFDPTAQGCSQCPAQSPGSHERTRADRHARSPGAGPRPGLGACARRARGLADRPLVRRGAAARGAGAARRRRLPHARRRRLRAQPRPRVSLQRQHRQAPLVRAGGSPGSACARCRPGLGARMAGADGGGAARHRAQRRARARQAARRARPRARRPRARARLPARPGAPCRRARPRGRAAGGERPRGDAAGARRAASRRPRPPTRAGRRSGAARGGRRRRRPCARPRAPAGREACAAPAAPGVARPDRRSRRQRAPTDSSATCTTVPSSGSWCSRSRCGCCAQSSTTTGPDVSTRPKRSCAPRSPSCASSPTGSTPPSSSTKGSPPRSRRSPRPDPCRS